MRLACGSNDNRDPISFIQMFRLLSTCSLVKSPLLNIEDISDSKERIQKLENVLDMILDKGECQEIPEVVAVIRYHDYSLSDTSSLVLSYLSRYIVRK